jgi:hypothetical protein
LLGRLFDYAGQFPPADLHADDAIREWKRIRASQDAWLANRFVARAGQVTGVEHVAFVDGAEERHDDVVFREVLPGAKLAGVSHAKLRCSGARVPSVEEVAQFIRRCRADGAVFKATAGLHHAFPTNGEHGFLNLLAACVFGDEEAMLTTREIALDADAFRARGLEADAEECGRVRRELFHSIGSCSFDEPVGELKALGIL